MTAYAFLVNPRAGGGAGLATARPVVALLRAAGHTAEVVVVGSMAETEALVEAATARGDVVVPVGGDGMVSSVAGGVARRDGTLGIVPAGRGSDFARVLGIPHQHPDPAALAEILTTGIPAMIDLIACTVGGHTRYVAGSVYSGVDAVAAGIAERSRWMPRRLVYPYAAVRALASYTPLRAEVVVDGVRYAFTAATVVVANSELYGAGMRIAPGASVTDGILDVVVVEASSRRALIGAMPTLYDGSHVERPDVTVLRGRVVELRGTPAVPMGGDGEPIGWVPGPAEEPARIEVRPRALRVLVPG